MTTNQHHDTVELAAESVANYLKSHPDFFEQHAKLLAEITLPSPHGSGVISLAERQQIAQRDKIRALEVMIEDMITNAEENEAIGAKIHQLSLTLLNQQNFNSLLKALDQSLKTDFSVTESQIKIWLKPSNSAIANHAVFKPSSDHLTEWVSTLKQPYCGEKPESALEGLDPALDPNLRSFACIPLCKNSADPHTFGVLILASENAERFKSGLGTHYLERIGELIAASLLNHIFALHL